MAPEGLYPMAFPDPRLHERRRLVAQLYLRQLSTREIADALRRQGWAASQATICRDLALITREWQRAALQDMAAHKAQELAKLNEIERTVWLEKPVDKNAILLRISEQRCKLLGLYDWRPPAVDVEKELAEMGLDSGDILRQVEALLAGNPEQE